MNSQISFCSIPKGEYFPILTIHSISDKWQAQLLTACKHQDFREVEALLMLEKENLKDLKPDFRKEIRRFVFDHGHCFEGTFLTLFRVLWDSSCNPHLFLFGSVMNNYPDLLEFSKEQGGNINHIFKGLPLLLGFSAAGEEERILILLKHGADTFLRDENDRSALLLAAMHGHLNVVKLLLSVAPKLLNLVDNIGSTPLIVALLKKQFAVAEYLIDAGADVTPVNRYGIDALDAASHHEDAPHLVDKITAKLG